jgi:hypothetical protein
MTLRQIAANRRNASKSAGPRTEEGKHRSRCNAVRHGLTAETVIDTLEDAEDYKAFEAAITADYDAQSAVERELVLRLAGLLWRLRRATTIEAGLFEIQVEHQGEDTKDGRLAAMSRQIVYAVLGQQSVQPDHDAPIFVRNRRTRNCRSRQDENSRPPCQSVSRPRRFFFAARQPAELCARPPKSL